MRVLFYTLTNKSNNHDYVSYKLKSIKEAFLATGMFLAEFTIFYDTGDHILELKNGKTKSGRGLNACINQIIENYIDCYDFFFRLDDTDNLIFQGIENLNYALDDDLTVLPKYVLSDEQHIVDTPIMIEEWKKLVRKAGKNNISKELVAGLRQQIQMA